MRERERQKTVVRFKSKIVIRILGLDGRRSIIVTAAIMCLKFKETWHYYLPTRVNKVSKKYLLSLLIRVG